MYPSRRERRLATVLALRRAEKRRLAAVAMARRAEKRRVAATVALARRVAETKVPETVTPA